MAHLRTALLLAACPTLGLSQSLTLEPVADTTIYETFFSELSNGAGEHLFAGRIRTGERRRALLRFDLADLPPGAVIDSARLELNMNRTFQGTLTVGLHAVTTAWSEGPTRANPPEGLGAAVEDGDASWSLAIAPDQSWNEAGGDFAAMASASAEVTDPGRHVWDGPALLADVERWRTDPDANFGWILVGDDGDGLQTAKRFNSRENANGGGPRLILTGTGLVPVAQAQPIAVPLLDGWALAALASLLVLTAGRRFQRRL